MNVKIEEPKRSRIRSDTASFGDEEIRVQACPQTK